MIEDSSTPDWSKTGRRVRLPASEVRSRLLHTALSTLRTTGLTVSLDHLNLEALIQEAGVPRSSVFRIWGNREKFFSDLILELAKPEDGETAFDPATIEVTERVIAENAQYLQTAEGRELLLAEVIRQGIAQNLASVRSSKKMQTQSAILWTLDTLPLEAQEALRTAVIDSDRVHIEAMSQLYDRLIPLFGRKPRDDFTTFQISASGAALVQGMIEREHTLKELANFTISRPGLDGKPVEWTLTAINFLAVIHAMTEPVDNE